MASVEEIAAEMKDALDKGGLYEMFDAVADHVESMNMVHEPGAALDGPVTGPELRAINNFERRMFAKIAPGGFTATAEFSIDGNVITTDLRGAYVMAEGDDPMTMHSLTTWTVEDGRVVACFAKQIPDLGADAAEKMAQMFKVMQEADIQIPTREELKELAKAEV